MTSTVCVAPLRKPNLNRKALMLSCAVTAVAAGTVAPQRARADAFNGTMVNSPAATRINTGTGTETISINPGASGKVTINWTPNEAGSGTINFLSNGNTATFQSVAGVTDYTVLNRVVPTDATRGISLNGTILSKLNDGSTGGRIWFYSPGGILVGSTARIDVGSLLLTTLDPVGFGSSADGFGQFQNQFDQASTITVDSLAQINANNAGSYVALIAPRVEQHGSVSVNGSAAYVAAEDVTMTINNGLFDIQVDLGTRDGNGIVHDGTTTGAANVDAGDNHSIYMVAVPKDTALTMLLSGNVGFAGATSATVENGQIVLSAGHDVFQGDFGVQFEQANAVDAGINLGTGSYTSNVVGQATSDVTVNPAAGNAGFSGDLDLTSVSGAVRLTATNGNQVNVGGAASLTSTKQFNPDLPQDPAIALFAGSGGKINVAGNLRLTARDDGFGGGFSHGGNIYVTADGGEVTVSGTVNADATARDSFPADESISDAEGGQIILRALNSGKLTTGSIVANASATGGYVNVQGASAGDGQGGRVTVLSQSNGLVTVNGNFQGVADGTGGDVFGNGDAAGNGSAGAVYFSAQTGGDINVTGSAFLTGDGYGGDVISPVTAFNVNGGIGRGSDYLQGSTTAVYGVGMETRDVNSAITVGGNVFMNANGFGGAGLVGGEAYGGDAGVRSFAGSIGIAGDLNFNARASGGNALAGFGGTGGYAVGGTTYVQAELSMGSSSAISGGNVTLDSGATGGAGGSGNGDNILAGAGGDATGGTYDGQKDGSGGAFVLADNDGAVLTLGDITLFAQGQGGQGGDGGVDQAGGRGGNGTGGSVQAGTFRRPPFTSVEVDGQVSLGDVYLDSSGFGGDGGIGDNGADDGAAGDGFGGGWCRGDGICGGSLIAARGTVEVASAIIVSQGRGGAGSTGGQGVGGDAEIYVPEDGLLTSGFIQIYASAVGGDGTNGSAVGGSANGGIAGIGIYDGGSLVASSISIDGRATGGAGTTGGAALGNGRAIVEVANGGSLSAGSLGLSSASDGGDAFLNGGAATGGRAELIVTGGSIDASLINLWAYANGGDSTVGQGGNANGGRATVDVTSGGAIDFGSQLHVDASAQGGATGINGGGQAGSTDVENQALARITINGGRVTGTGDVSVTANATAGANSEPSGVGTNAYGGQSRVSVSNGTLQAGSLQVIAGGTGGNGDALGGSGYGGVAYMEALSGGAISTVTKLLIDASGTGASAAGQGGYGEGGAGTLYLDGGSVTVTSTSLDDTNPTFQISTFGNGGVGAIGGDALGGDTAFLFGDNGGSLSVAGFGVLWANANGGVGTNDEFGNGGAGGNATGGTVTFNSPGNVTVASLRLAANAFGGDGGAGSIDGNGGNGGNATGGTVTADIYGNTTTGDLVLRAFGEAGFGGAGINGGRGGDGTGGSSTLTVHSGILSTADIEHSTYGFAGNGGAGTAGVGGNGGDALGGTLNFLVAGGSMSAGAIANNTNGFGGDGGAAASGVGGAGGNAQAGTSTITIDGALTALGLGSLNQGLAGDGGAGTTQGDGGSGTGGSVTATINGSVNITGLAANNQGNFTMTAFGEGGNGGNGGTGQGGSSTVTNNGILSISNRLQVTAQSLGGDGSSGTGGQGNGGSASLVNTGTLSAVELFQGAGGTGGAGVTAGGDAMAGTATISQGGDMSLAFGNLVANAVGGAASGGDGGDALSGEAWLTVTEGGTLTSGDLTVSADATGGAGTTSGGDAANEVYARMQVDAGGSADVSGTTTISANATGGAATTGIGGQAFGGQASLIVYGSASTGATILQASGTGGAGATNGSGDGGTVNVTVSGALQTVSMNATANGSVGAGDILIDLLSGTMDLGIATLTANGASPAVGEDGIEIGSQGTLTASQLTMNSSDGIRISTANGGTINVSGTIDANSQALIRLLDDGAGGAISSNILDLAGADIQITALVQAADILMTLPGDYAINGLPVATDSLTITAGGNITAAANLTYANSLELIAGADISILDLATGGDLTLATPGAITAGTIDAGGKFLALAHGDMAFGDVTASEVFLADFSMLTPTGSVTGVCVGTCGTLGADGVVTAPPSGSTYQFVTTDGGVTGEGQLAGVGGTNGSSYTTSAFTAAAGDDLSFFFNYVTSDGSTFTDYAWAQLLTGNLDPVAILYTARTQPSGTIVPGQGLPGVEATLNPASVPIIPDATTWSPLGLDSGSCFDLGCGNTGWIGSTYQIANAGTYVLRFGVSNFSDTGYQSGMAFSGISIGGQTVSPGLTPTLGSITIGNVTTGNMQAAAGTTLTTGAINATDFVDLHSGGNMQTGNITAGQYLQADAGGAMNLGVLSIGQDVNLNAAGNISFVSANAGTEFDFDTGGNINGGNITAGNHIGGSAAGTITLADLTVTGGLATGESFSVGMDAGGDIVIGNVSATNAVGFATPGNLTTGNVTAGGLFMTLVGGDIGVGSITTDAAGRVYLADYSMFAAAGGSDNFNEALVLASAPVATSGSIAINGPVSTGIFQAAAGTTFNAGDISAATSIAASAGGNLQVGNAQAGTSIDLSSGGSIVSTSLDAPFVSLTLAGDFTTGDLFVDNSLAITAGGNLTAGNILAGGDLALTAGLVLTAQDLNAGGDLILSAGGNIGAGDLSAGGSMNFNSTAGAISAGSLDAAGGLFASAANGVAIADATVGLGVEIHTGGDLTIGSVGANTGVELDAAGDVWASDIDSGSHVIVTAGGDFEVSDVTAGTTANFTAGGLASFLGIVSAPDITVTSADIDIVDGASLGVLGTTDLITFNAVSAGQEVILGGDGTEAAAGQYQLAEDGDIESDTVVFNAVGASQGQPVNVRVLDAEIEGSATQGGGVSSVTLNTAGSVFVKGVLSFTGAAATDKLSIHAGDSIQVVTDTGGIEMLGTDGNVAGTLDLTAHDIWVADQALLDQLNGASDLAAFEDALATNNGAVVPDGYLRAGGIDVTMLGSSLLVQNTGTDTDPAGLTIGDGGLNIVNQGSEPATVIIFGHRQNADGTTTGGDAFLDEVQFSGPGGFDNSSTVNGCDVDGCGPTGETPGTIGGVESILGPIGLMSNPAALASSGGDDFALLIDEGSDEASDEDDEDSSDEDSSVDASVGLINTGPVSVEPPVEEPVTSGNDGPGF